MNEARYNRQKGICQKVALSVSKTRFLYLYSIKSFVAAVFIFTLSSNLNATTSSDAIYEITKIAENYIKEKESDYKLEELEITMAEHIDKGVPIIFKNASTAESAKKKREQHTPYWFVYFTLKTRQPGGSIGIYIDHKSKEVFEVYKSK